MWPRIRRLGIPRSRFCETVDVRVRSRSRAAADGLLDTDDRRPVDQSETRGSRPGTRDLSSCGARMESPEMPEAVGCRGGNPRGGHGWPAMASHNVTQACANILSKGSMAAATARGRAREFARGAPALQPAGAASAPRQAARELRRTPRASHGARHGRTSDGRQAGLSVKFGNLHGGGGRDERRMAPRVAIYRAPAL